MGSRADGLEEKDYFESQLGSTGRNFKGSQFRVGTEMPGLGG